MNYRDFNHRVYKYYIENLIPGEYNTLTIPKSDFDELIGDEAYIKNFKEIKIIDWSLLLKYDGGIPKYLGLLAIQSYAAFYMQKYGGIRAANFRDRFIAITGIDSTLNLHQLFSEKFSDKLNVQEKIWFAAQSFFEKENILLDIPQPKPYARRNTQFPESQCVLNYEDLKEYRIFYLHIYANYETIYYDDFILKLNKFRIRLSGELTRQNNLIEFSDIKEKIKKRQIFDFYNSLDWLRFESEQPSKKVFSKDFIAKLESDKVVIYNDDFEVFKNYTSLLDKNKLAIFKQDEVYKTEYSQCNHVNENTSFIILTSSKIISDELINYNGNKINLYSAPSNLFGVLIDLKDKLPSSLYNYQLREFPVKLLGAKITAKRQYLISNVPRLESKVGISYRLFCNNKQVAEAQPSSLGKYLIKVNGYTSYSFEIVSIESITDSIIENQLKFNLLNLEYNLNGQMTGLDIKPPETNNNVNLSINDWIKILATNKNQFRKSASNNFLINVINQYKYGKNK